MPKEIKEKIYEFLKENRGKRFNLKEISKKTKISYPSVLKWLEVLIIEQDREPQVNIEDYGNVKLVWIN